MICQDVTNLTFDKDSFDLVISSDVMEHVHDSWKGFEEVVRVLKPGGAYIFTIPVRLPLSPNIEVRARIDEGTWEIEHLLLRSITSQVNWTSLWYSTILDLIFSTDLKMLASTCHSNLQRLHRLT